MSLVEKIGLNATWTAVLTMGIMCAILYIIHRLTKEVKCLQSVGPQVPTFLIAAALSNSYILPGPKYPLYSSINSIVLPISLALMLLSIDIKSVTKTIGFRPFILMVFACFATFIGGLVSGLIFTPDQDGCIGLAAAVAMGIGGAENYMATANALKMSEDKIGVMLAVALVAYAVAISIQYFVAGNKPLTTRLDAWIKPKQNPREIAEFVKAHESERTFFKWGPVVIQAMIASACLCVAFSNLIGKMIPKIALPGGGVLTISWYLVLTTVCILVDTLTPAKKIPNMQTVGLATLYISVMAVFAKTNIIAAFKYAHLFFIILLAYLIHIALIYISAKLLRVDSVTAVTASVAALGGAASAPLVPMLADLPELIPLSVLLATVGYALANYMGWGLGEILLSVIYNITI